MIHLRFTVAVFTSIFTLWLLLPAVTQGPIYDVPCGGINDLGAAQAAVNSAAGPNSARSVRLHNTCAFPSGGVLVAPNNVRIVGDGLNNTWIIKADCASGAIFFNPPGVSLTQAVNIVQGANATFTLEDLSIQYPAACAVRQLVPVPPSSPFVKAWAVGLQSQSAVVQPNGPTALTQPRIRNVGIYNAPNGILAVDVTGGDFAGIVLMNFGGEGLHFVAVNYPDGGGNVVHDGSIVNYLGSCSGPAGRGIVVEVGGTKIHDMGFACLYDGIFVNVGPTSQIGITQSTFDTMANTATWYQRANVSVTFQNFSFTNNKCALMAGAVCLYSATDSVWSQGDVITGNQATGRNASLFYIDGMDTVSMLGNTMINEGAPGTATGINIGAHSTNLTIGGSAHGGAAFGDSNVSGNPQVTMVPGR